MLGLYRSMKPELFLIVTLLAIGFSPLCTLQAQEAQETEQAKPEVKQEAKAAEKAQPAAKADPEVIKKAMMEMMERRAQVLGARRVGNLAVNGQREEDDENPIPNVSIAKSSGTFEKLRVQLSPYLKIEEKQGQAGFSLPMDMQTAHTLRNDIGRVLRNYGGSSYSSGNGFQSLIRCREINGTVKRFNNESSLLLKETAEQKRTLHVTSSNDQARLVLSSPSGYYLLLRFSDQGQVHVVECDGDFLFNKSFSSLSKLQLAESEYYEKRLSPIMTRFGIVGPTQIFFSKTKSLARQLLVRSSEDLAKFVEEHERAVTSRDYLIRRDALKKLANEFEEQVNPMLGVILSEDQPAEFRHQLLDVLKVKDAELHQVVERGFLSQDLLSNLSFLTWLLKSEEQNEKDPDVTKQIRTRLAKITDLPADSPIEDWMGLILDFEQEETIADLSGVQQWPVLDVNAESVGYGLSELVVLKSYDGRLNIDRQQWKKPFGDKTLSQHYAELQQELKEKGFPGTWLTIPAEISLSQDSHPLVLFGKIEISDVERNARRPFPVSSYQARHLPAPKNQLMLETGRHRLCLDMGPSEIRLNSSTFQFDWSTSETDELSIMDTPDTAFCLVVQLAEKQERLMLRSTDTAFTVQCLQGEKLYIAKTDSYEAFCEQYPEAWQALNASLVNSVRMSLPDPTEKTSE